MSRNPFDSDDVGTGHYSSSPNKPFDDKNNDLGTELAYDSPRFRALASQQRALASMGHSEQVGVSTLEELDEQGEKLNRAEERLKQIGELQKDSQRQISSLNSWFKGWFSKKIEPKAAVVKCSPNESDHEVSTQRRISPATEYLSQNPIQSSSYQAQNPFRCDQSRSSFDSNMDQMSAGMTRLKNLASTMNSELKAQNEQLERLEPTMDRVSGTMSTQNRQMNKLLGARGAR